MPIKGGKRKAVATILAKALPSDERTEGSHHAVHNINGLTEKQEAFAQGVANNLTLIDAYKAAYNTETGSVSTLYSSASRLADNPKVAARIRSIMEARSERFEAFDVMRIRRHVFDRLMIESMDYDNPAASRVRSLELLGKIDVVSMFKEQKDTTPDAPDSVAELTDKLKKAISRMTLVNPISVPEKAAQHEEQGDEGEQR